jgi:50S ribosomal protein L16 3-hydroxylase
MIDFGQVSREEFLEEYWQKKPLLIKRALPNFISPLSPDELAGLSFEEEFE